MAQKDNEPNLSIPKLDNKKALQSLWRAFAYLKPYKRIVVGVYAIMLVINLMNVLIPQFIRWIIDRGIIVRDLQLLGWSVLGLLGLVLLKGVLTFFQGRSTEVASQSVAYDLRNAIQTKLTQLSFSYHDQTETGQLLSRTLSDVERIRFLTGRAVFRIVDTLVLFTGTAAILAWMNPRLTLLALCTMPLLVYRALKFGSQYRPLSVAIQEQLATLTSRVEQNLRGTRVVKAFAQETVQTEAFEKENQAWFNLAALAARLQGFNTPLLDLIANIGTVFIIWYGGSLVIQQQLTLGELVAFSTYLAQLTGPVRFLGMIIPAIAMASASAERVFEILDAQSEVKNLPDAVPLPASQGHVRFDQITFAYADGHTVLKEIDLEAQPGQIIALVGPTGSGKSSIINLIPRFYDPTAGRILIDGHDIRQFTLQSLRSQIGIVLQETILFAASIRENIAFGRPEASEAEIIAAARAAQAYEFISQMPEGFDTYVGERGVTLSGGQKQRVAIARALLTDPRILILDDATASVDTGTEQLLQKALDRLMQGRTTFVIAHRLSTVRRADMILVLDKGQIVDRGRHETLLRDSAHYAEIYRRQLQPQETALAGPPQTKPRRRAKPKRGPLTQLPGGQRP